MCSSDLASFDPGVAPPGMLRWLADVMGIPNIELWETESLRELLSRRTYARIKTEIAQLENQRKRLLQAEKEQERKDRTRRLCSRHGLLEKMLPEIITITDEQFQAFLEKVVTNNYGRDILNKIIAQNAAAPTPNSTNAARESGKDADKDEGNGEAETP